VGGWAGRGIAKLGKAARGASRAEPQITIRASEVNRVEGMGEHWFDIPDLSRPGSTTRLPGNSGRDPNGQVTLGGRPMQRSEVPEELFHVTSDMQGIMSDGMIRVSEGLNRGAGGYSGTGAVSTTASREVAEVLRNDLIAFATIKTFRTNQEALDFFLDLARKSNFDEAGLARMTDRAAEISRSERATPADLGKALFNDWSFSRRHYGGPPSSIVLGDPVGPYWQTVRPENIDIIPMRKNMIPEDALVSNYDLGRNSLEEIQVFSDISIGSARATKGSWVSDPNAEEVSVAFLRQFREHDRGRRSLGTNIDELAEEISARGFDDALILEVDPSGRAVLIEGNHRLAAAEQLGLERVPVRVITSSEGRLSGSGAEIAVREGLRPGNLLKPSDVFDVDILGLR
jgi:hypothetical protein